MGSGHILVYAFEVFMQIYETCGYTQRDAASLIIEKNLYGLDIDNRAYQLAYFAVMMKGRKYDRRFLTKGISPNLCPIEESNSLISFEQGAGQLKIDDLHKETANYLVTTFRDAKEYGSILNIEPRDYDGLLSYIGKLQQNGVEDLLMAMWLSNISAIIPSLIKQAKIMAQKYDVVVTNPPYMGIRNMGDVLSDYVSENYPSSKYDLFSVFIEKSLDITKNKGYVALITQNSWMFLNSYEKMRNEIINFYSLDSMLHLGYGTFGADFGTTSFVFRKYNIKKYNAVYIRLADYRNIDDKIKNYWNQNLYYYSSMDKFELLPRNPFAYWISDNGLRAFIEGKPLKSIAEPRQGMASSDNNRFVRLWSEVLYNKIGFGCSTSEIAIESQKKWFPYNNGGEFRKWYGNNCDLVNWENDGKEVKEYAASLYKSFSRTIKSISCYFKEGGTWNAITSSSSLSVRYFGEGFIFSNAGMAVFDYSNILNIKVIIAYLNSKVIDSLLKYISPTLNFNQGDIAQIPIIIDKSVEEIQKLADNCILISKTDWDSYEMSWDFVKHPLIQSKAKIADCFEEWKQFTENQFTKLKANEEELNSIFIEIYGLQNELTPEVDDKDVTIRKADLQRDIRSLVSYAVGCMFGRYSLDVEGLAYAGGEWDDNKYKTFIPDKDNIIPITDDEYFDDDIVDRFVKFVKVVYGEDTLEENLDFIAEALGNKGSTSREVIRNYFLKAFYKDHVKTYQKRPIYWLFDSGKENGFKALIYLHRYNEDTVGRVRADYLHKTQAAIENAIAHCDVVLESNASASDKAKAVKQKEKLVKQLAETRIYDQAIAHIAHQRVSLDLDDGVVANYAKFQGIVVSSEGKKSVKVDLLGKI